MTIRIASVFLLLLQSTIASDARYGDHCSIWENVTARLMSLPSVRGRTLTDTCQRDEQCAGFMCSATFDYQGFYTLFKAEQYKYCFGVTIQPCTTPTTMSFYLDFADNKNGLFYRTVSNTTDFQLPGVHFGNQNVNTLDGFVHVDMQHHNRSSVDYLQIRMQFKMRVKTLGGIEYWPDEFKQDLIPAIEVPKPTCNPKVRLPTGAPPICPNITASSFTSPPTTTSSPGKSCTPGRVNQRPDCTPEEMCQQLNNSPDKGQCVCLPDYQRLGSKCVATVDSMQDIIYPPIATTPNNSMATSAKNNNTNVVIYSCIGGLAGLALVALIIVLAVRCYRRNQHPRDSRLINNEPDDDDDPLDVST